MSVPISTNVPLIFANLIALEKLKAVRGQKGLLLYVISPWIRDVIFPISEFGISDPSVGSTSSLTSEIIGEMSQVGADVRICTLHYFSDAVGYKNPFQQSNPANRIQQAFRDLEEIDVLNEFQARGAKIFLNKNFHSKTIVTSGGLYDGSFNFTLAGYYRNRENGTLVSNSGSGRDIYKLKLSELDSTFFRDEYQASEVTMKSLTVELESLIKETRKNWDDLVREYFNRQKRKVDRRMDELGITI